MQSESLQRRRARGPITYYPEGFRVEDADASFVGPRRGLLLPLARSTSRLRPMDGTSSAMLAMQAIHRAETRLTVARRTAFTLRGHVAWRHCDVGSLVHDAGPLRRGRNPYIEGLLPEERPPRDIRQYISARTSTPSYRACSHSVNRRVVQLRVRSMRTGQPALSRRLYHYPWREATQISRPDAYADGNRRRHNRSAPTPHYRTTKDTYSSSAAGRLV